MRAVVVSAVLAALLGACGQHSADEYSTQSSGASEAVHPAEALPDPPAQPEPSVEARSCDAYGSCGCWRGCAWFEQVELAGDGPAVFRHVGTDDRYVRQRHCWPDGSDDCYEFCRTDGSCVDGMAPEAETCTGSCAPRRAPFSCEARGEECQRVDGENGGSPTPPPAADCPHSEPAQGSACGPQRFHACTYSGPDATCSRRIATCRDGHWQVSCLPP